MPKYNQLLEGAIELHCHSAPSIFPRRQTDWQLMADAKAAGMAGVLLKSHESETASRASLLNEKLDGIRAYGGLACNYPTGGLSAAAVDNAIKLGARCIWMPTISSTAHFEYFASKKTKLFGGKPTGHNTDKGLTILGKSGKILPEVQEILRLAAEADIILCSGHLQPNEVMVLVEEAHNLGIKKILIQHADMGIAKIPMDLQIKLANKGAVIEKCYLATGRDFKDLSVKQMVNSIKQLGHDSCALVTDYGQAHNIPVVQALSNFTAELQAAGLSAAAIKQMLNVNTRKLLGI